MNMEIILLILVIIIVIGMACSVCNNEYKDWKMQKEANEWFKQKYKSNHIK